MKSIILILISLFILSSCGHSWTPEEKLAMKNKCESIDTLDQLSFELSGFNLSEIDTILIREKSGKNIIDSFYVSAKYEGNGGRYFCLIDRTINLKNSFEILIPNQRLHVLSGMKWEMAAHYTNDGEGYGCEFGKVYLDSVPYSEENNDKWTIRKE